MRKTDLRKRGVRGAGPAWPGLLLLAGLAACTSAPLPVKLTTAAEPAAPACQVGPDGARLITDRGIGGTGSASAHVADRGIGGTGAPAGVQRSDRGIGGTGIIGVVTGFASVCLAGQEVALDDGVPVVVEGKPAGLDALRAGQVAAIEAEGPVSALRARSVAIRFEVSGPVEAVGPGGKLRVAGQVVVVSAQTWGARDVQPGAWVDVSGLRDADDVVRATRIDLRPPGRVVLHGLLRRTATGMNVGGTPIDAPVSASVAPGQSVIAVGRDADGRLRTESLVADVLADDPVAYFDGFATSFVFEGYVAGGYSTGGNGAVRYAGSHVTVPTPATGAPAPGSRAVFTFERRPDGTLRTQSLRPYAAPPESGRSVSGRFGAAPTPAAAGRSFAPAPIPNRNFDRAGFSPGRSDDGGNRGSGASSRAGPRSSGGEAGMAAVHDGGTAPVAGPNDGGSRGGTGFSGPGNIGGRGR